MYRPYKGIHKVILSAVPVGCLLCVGFLFSSCIFNRQSVQPEESVIVQQDAMDPLLEEVKTLFAAGDYDTPAQMLRTIGQQEYSYHRMDEVLYWLGRCNLSAGDPTRASRCFTLLRKYYPRSHAKFPYLTDLEERTEQALAALWDAVQLEAAKNDSNGNSNADTEKKRRYAGPLVSNAFYETDIRQALMDLSAQTGIAIIPDAMVRGYITMDIIDMPLEQALSLLLSPLGFSFRKIENYYLVGEPSTDNPSFPLLAQTEEIKPKHLPAADVPKLLPDYYGNFLKVNKESNTLVISAPPEIISRFKEELAAIDTPPQQIMIEAVVVEMGDEARRSLGLEWDWTGTKANNSFQIAKLLPSAADTAYFFAELFKTDEHYKGMIFDLRQEATIRIGKEAYYSLLQGSTVYSYVTLEKISTGIILKITPYVGCASDIIADIVIEVSDVTGSGATDLPVTSVRSVETRVQVSNGQTIGIGGLLSESTREERHRIPFLGDIPILGYLFGNTTTTKEETEVVVLITPHLLINPNEFDKL